MTRLTTLLIVTILKFVSTMNVFFFILHLYAVTQSTRFRGTFDFFFYISIIQTRLSFDGDNLFKKCYFITT